MIDIVLYDVMSSVEYLIYCDMATRFYSKRDNF